MKLSMRKGMDVGVGNSIGFMIGVFLLLTLAFTWFFPTINGATALNNQSTLWLGGVDYNWAVPLISVVLIIALVIIVLKKAEIM